MLRSRSTDSSGADALEQANPVKGATHNAISPRFAINIEFRAVSTLVGLDSVDATLGDGLDRRIATGPRRGPVRRREERAIGMRGCGIQRGSVVPKGKITDELDHGV